MRRAFTMVELMVAVSLVGVLTAISVAVFYQVSHSWQASCDYIDKMQRTDFALTQLFSGLRSMYYPHDGKSDERYGFTLVNNGDGDSPHESDVIEWSKIGTAIVGNKSVVADTVHRVQVMVLEEGPSDYRDADGRRIDIKVTGLYARQCPDAALRRQDEEGHSGEVDYSFANEEMYEPVLIADGIVGFDCKVIPSAEKSEESDGEPKFEEEFSESNSVPYKVQLTFFISDPEGKSYRTHTAPLIRIVRIPIHEQSLDGATTPAEDSKQGGVRGGKGTGGKGAADGKGASGGKGAGGAGATGGGNGAGGAQRGGMGGGQRGGGGMGGGQRGGGMGGGMAPPPGGAR